MPLSNFWKSKYSNKYNISAYKRKTVNASFPSINSDFPEKTQTSFKFYQTQRNPFKIWWIAKKGQHLKIISKL